MTRVNAILGGTLELLLQPFAYRPLLGLAAISFLTAVATLLVMRVVSPQDRVARVKRQILAGLFELRLFSSDLRAIFRALGDILLANASYLGLSLIPMCVMALPLALVVTQLQSYFGYAGLEIERPAIVSVRMPAGTTERPALTLVVPSGLRVDTPPLWIPSAREMDWRVTATNVGAYQISVRLDQEVIGKEVHVSSPMARYSPARVAPGVLNQFLYPAEDPLPAGTAIDAIEVNYATREINLLGWPLHWSVVFLLFTMLCALVLQRPFGVRF